MLDIIGDGLINICCIQDRWEDNILSPGVLLINQGDMTWKENTNMREYTLSIMFIDVDGDEKVKEIIIRWCFYHPQRFNATQHSMYGLSLDGIVEFWKNEPVGSISVYQYNKLIKEINYYRG